MGCEAVVVKAFKGIALNRWMVGTVGGVAVITDADGAEACKRGQTPRYSVGFPKSDVFCLPDRSIEDGSSPNWDEMRRRF